MEIEYLILERRCFLQRCFKKIIEWLALHANEVPKLKFDLLKYEFKKFAREYAINSARNN
jgi:hypothetical protein